MQGNFIARAWDWKLGFTSTGKEQIAVSLEITQGEFKGKHLNWYGFFTEKTQERTIESLRIMGWEGVDLADVDNLGLNHNEVAIVVEEETGEDGKTYSKVRWINKVGGGLSVKAEMDAGQRTSFAQRMKASVLAFDQKSKAAGQSAKPNGATKPSGFSSRGGVQRPEPPPLSDDEIPF